MGVNMISDEKRRGMHGFASAKQRPLERWQRSIGDAGGILDGIGGDARIPGWTTEDVFGLDSAALWPRIDAMKLTWLTDGGRVVAITSDTARIATRTGAVLAYYRSPPAGRVPAWSLVRPDG